MRSPSCSIERACCVCIPQAGHAGGRRGLIVCRCIVAVTRIAGGECEPEQRPSQIKTDVFQFGNSLAPGMGQPMLL
jgi:hypothetical protein